MKMTDMRAKARAIFGPAIAEPMPNQPNGAKALQERANARPIPTYKVGGSVKKSPPQPTAAEREADRKRRESLANTKVTQSEADTLGRAMRSEGPRYKDGGKVQTSADTAKKLATEMGGMKKGGKPKKDGLAVMIAIGSPMKGMKKPVKKMNGGMASMIPAPDGPPTAPMDRQREFGMGRDPVPQTINPARMPGQPGAGPTKAAPSAEAALRQKMTIEARDANIKHIQETRARIAERRKEAELKAIMKQKEAMARKNPKRDMQINRGPVPIAKGGVVKKAAGGAAKVRKGMMTPEGVITHAMNKVRGK